MAHIADHLLENSISNSTQLAYDRSLQALYRFAATELRLDLTLPIPSSIIIAFIAHLFASGNAASTIATHLSALAFIHKIRGLPDPTDSFVIRKMIRGAEHLRGGQDIRAPITAQLLHQLAATTTETTSSMYLAKLLRAMYLLAFHGFLRIGELAARTTSQPLTVLQLHDICISPTSITIRMANFKHHRGPPVSLNIPTQTPMEYCPVQALREFLAIRGTQPGPLFCFPGGSPVTKAFFSNCLQASLNRVGASSTRIKSHSFRIGAATHAALAGVPEDKIQRMGRWRSSAFKRYVRINMLRL